MQHRFAELGIDPVPELVELYAWRRPEDYPGLFWEADLFGIDQAVEVWRANRSVIEGHPDWERDAEELMSWPGPTTFFPALIGVGNSGDCLMVDNSAGPDRGGLWWVVTQDDSRKVFESLDEALRAAIHCVSEALWTRDGAVVECLRTHQPWPHDRVHPPWCDEHH